MQADAKERIAKGVRGGAYSDNQRIESFQTLINDANEDLTTEGEKPIKITKKQVKNFELSSKERFAYNAGGFTPLVFEFAAAGYLTNGVLNMTRIPNYLNKIKTPTYLTKNGTMISGTEISRRAALANKSTKKYVDGVNKAANKKYGKNYLTLNSGKTWQKGLHVAAYSLVEEGKMMSLDPLFGTEMPRGSGIGLYAGGDGAIYLMPWKFGSQGSKFYQKAGRMINPFSEKIVKGGIGGAAEA